MALVNKAFSDETRLDTILELVMFVDTKLVTLRLLIVPYEPTIFEILEFVNDNEVIVEFIPVELVNMISPNVELLTFRLFDVILVIIPFVILELVANELVAIKLEAVIFRMFPFVIKVSVILASIALRLLNVILVPSIIGAINVPMDAKVVITFVSVLFVNIVF